MKAVGGKLVWGDENAAVTNVSTDSREVKTGTLFVPIIGERVDAHRFISDVLEAGASCVFFSDDREKEKKGAGIYVSNTLLAMQKFAAWYRSKLPVRIIGITGSVGKTTTKEMPYFYYLRAEKYFRNWVRSKVFIPFRSLTFSMPLNWLMFSIPLRSIHALRKRTYSSMMA